MRTADENINQWKWKAILTPSSGIVQKIPGTRTSIIYTNYIYVTLLAKCKVKPLLKILTKWYSYKVQQVIKLSSNYK